MSKGVASTIPKGIFERSIQLSYYSRNFLEFGIDLPVRYLVYGLMALSFVLLQAISRTYSFYPITFIVSVSLGILLGRYQARKVTNIIRTTGEYRGSRRRWLIQTIGTILILVIYSWSAWFSQSDLSISPVFTSAFLVMMSISISAFAGLGSYSIVMSIILWRWETVQQKDLIAEGSLLKADRIYAEKKDSIHEGPTPKHRILWKILHPKKPAT